MHRVLPAVIATAAIAIPFAANGATALTAHAATARTVTYRGPSVDMRWGPVQVAIVVRNRKIVDVQASAPTERRRSEEINSQALPLLKSEVLRAQNANIDLLSEATMTSQAYDMSLQAAINSARKAHGL